MHWLPFLTVLLWPSLAVAEEAMIVPQFAEETQTSGITTKYSGEWEYMVGGGIASFDCNGDGFNDVLIAGGTSPAAFYENVSKRGGELKFRKRNSGLEFKQVTGAYPLDVDGDGIMDLVLLRVGENKIMRGLGKCRFADANKRWGFDGGDAWSTSLAATWEKGASFPTIAIGNYIDRKQETSPWGSCTDNWLHRPDSERQRLAKPLALKPSFCALSMLFTDWNRTGTPSLRVSNDREYYEGGQEQMWKVSPAAAPILYTEAEGWKFLRIWGMGIASSDVNADGYPDYFLTSMADHKLQVLDDVKQNPIKPGYTDIAFKRHVTLHRPYMGTDLKPSTGWHAQFADVNNDGRMDLFVAKGNVAEMKDFAAKDPNNLDLMQADGTFVEAGDKANVASTETSRGAGVDDFNLDGKLDLIVVNRWTTAQVWRNVSAQLGNWVAVKVSQPKPNRQAINGWLEITRGDKVESRELTVGGGHASGQAGWIHIGLGDADGATVRVRWPDGTVSDSMSLTAGKFFELQRGGEPKEWQPKR